MVSPTNHDRRSLLQSSLSQSALLSGGSKEMAELYKSQTQQQVPSDNDRKTSKPNEKKVPSKTLSNTSSSVSESGHGSQHTTRYKLVGWGFQWDASKGLPLKRLAMVDDDDHREVYAVSVNTTMPVEYFNVIDAQLGWKRRFYPMGNRSRQLTRVLEGNEHRGHNVAWAVTGMDIGTTLTIYFCPTDQTLAWRPVEEEEDDEDGKSRESGISANSGDFSSLEVEQLDTKGGGLTADDVWAVTQFELDESDLANVLLMAADRKARVIIAVFIMVPHLIMTFLMIWVVHSANKQMSVTFYVHDTQFEWICVFAIYFAIATKTFFAIGERIAKVFRIYALASKVYDNADVKRGLYIGANFALLNVLQDPIAFCLSIFVAIYLSENVFLNVLLNVAAMEFVTEVDDAMIAAYSNWQYGDSTRISMAILDLTYACHVDEGIDVWHKSDSSKDRVLENLCKGDISNDQKFELLASRSKGLGLLDRLADGSELVTEFRIHLGIVDWEQSMDDGDANDEMAKHGGLYLAGTSEETWEQCIGREKRAVLFQNFPKQTVDFPWFGVMNLDHIPLNGAFHAHYIVQIFSLHTEVHSVSTNFCNLGDDGVKVLCDGFLAEHEKNGVELHHLSLNSCALTDDSTTYLAKLLRGTDTLKLLYLVGNKGISDTGARRLSDALTQGDNANKTIHRITMGLNNVSPSCQEKCVKDTQGRMVFPSELELAGYQISGTVKQSYYS